MDIVYKVNGKYIICDVSKEECKNFKCFSPHKYIHQQKSIDGKDSSRQDKYYSCSHRNYHGCPKNPVK